MNILVTGGAGYVGSCLVKNLISQGHHIKCLDRFFMGDEFLKKLASENNNLVLLRDDIRFFSEEFMAVLVFCMDSFLYILKTLLQLFARAKKHPGHVFRARACTAPRLFDRKGKKTNLSPKPLETL